MEFVCLLFASDACSANVWARYWIISECVQFNEASTKGKILVLDTSCYVHILTNLIIKQFAYRKFIPKIYACCFVYRFCPRLNKLVKQVRARVAQQLTDGGFVASGQPAPREWRDHVVRVLRMTILRSLHTRGREALSCPSIQ